MNERIEELKQKAYVIKDGEFCFDGGKVEILDVNKLAELIVLKCAEIADTAEPFLSSDLIKEHFGVEE
jgi:hypothetical protein